MAIDTRSKRASALSALRPYVISPILPDGELDVGDRKHLSFLFSISNALISIILSVERFEFNASFNRIEFIHGVRRFEYINDFDSFNFTF